MSLSAVRGIPHRVSRYFRFDIYRRLVPYFWPYKRTMAVVIGLTVLGSVMSLATPWPMKFLVDNGLGGRQLPHWARSIPLLSGSGAVRIIVIAVVAGVLLKVIRNALDIVDEYLKTRVNWLMVVRFKADLFNHLQRLSFSYHDRVPVGDSVYRVQEDTSFISTLVWSNFRHLLTATITFGGMLYILVRLDWQLTLLALASVPITFATIAWSSNRFRGRSKQIKAMESSAQTIVQEVLSCLRVVKAFGQEHREQKRFETQVMTAMRARLRLMLAEDFVGAGMSLVSNVNRAAILLIGALHVHDGRITLGDLLVVLAYLDNLYWPIDTIGSVLTDMQLSLASAERVMEVLDVEPEVQDRPGAKSLKRVEGAVAFESVDFAYVGGERVLHEVSFKSSPGEVVAIVGPTGAGKTTIASLLVRFYDPRAGRVTLDGHDLRDLSVQTLRDNISLVIQEPILFSGTIRENICYGRPDASMEEIAAAAKYANAHDFISALPDGYDTEVGERGMRVSGGERQRIAVARAFLKDAPVLVLDEPTSSIDSRTEAVILDALDRLMVGRTTFIIAHRLSTLRRADQILVVEAGRVVEQGTHTELLVRNGLYAELFRLQTAAPKSAERLPLVTASEQ